MNIVGVREILLNLDLNEKKERKKVMRDYFFYKGKSIDLNLAKSNPVFYGQNWPVNEKLDYEPTQDIRNKVKQLLKKQARFMFSSIPTLNIKPDNLNDFERAEDLRKFVEDILEDNKFWKITKQAFLMATIEKRVLLRVEANIGEPIKIKYETIDNISYKETDGKLLEVKVFEPSQVNALYEDGDDRRVYYINIYKYKTDDKGNVLPDVWYIRETYTNNEFNTPTCIKEVNTGFTNIPCWLIVNGGELNNGYGESDLQDLIEPQTLYNKKNSDFADALRFQLFGAIAVIDGNMDDVARMQIRPNALHAIRTSDEAAEQSKQGICY
ncbi:phage portal protein [Clostridium kluyveri]|uniref:phage portal protein n=1 Tax=Clostridium kluyveri TaxID=1534 RepID=UPI002245A321|nr:phage portal protein [Clostridium kluyveri]UZQ49100.1 phage portal protein [Clostridium kluyveri]